MAISEIPQSGIPYRIQPADKDQASQQEENRKKEEKKEKKKEEKQKKSYRSIDMEQNRQRINIIV